MKGIKQTLRFVFLVAVASLSGCMKSDDGKIQLRYMAWGNPEQLELEERMCAKFNERQDRVHVRFFKVPSSAYGNKMLVMLASHTAPDIMRVDHYGFPSLVKKDYFYALDDLIKEDKGFSLDDFFKSAIDEGRYNGKLYGLNVLFGGPLIYYNKTLVKNAGLEDPYDLFRQGKWTWDAFREYAIKMTKKGSHGRYSQFGASIPYMPITYATVQVRGGQIMDPSQTRVMLSNESGTETWKFWYELRHKYHAAPTPSQSANSVFSFESGKLGMYFDFMGMTPRYRQVIKSFDWDVVPMPCVPGSKYIVKGNQLSMYAETKHPKEAWEFMKFLTSPEIEKQLAIDLRRTFPSRKSIAYSKEYLKSDIAPRHIDSFLYTIEHGVPFPITSRWNDWVGEYNSGLDNLMSGNSSDVKGAAQEAKKRADLALSTREGL